MYRNRRDIGQYNPKNLPPTYFVDLPPYAEDGKDLLIVQMKSQQNNKYVEIGFNEFFYAVGDTPLTGKIFSFILLPNNKILIRLHGARFLTIDNNGYLVVDLTNKEPSVFQLDKIDNSIYSIIAPNGKHIKVNQRDNRLIADEDTKSNETAFKFRLISYY